MTTAEADAQPGAPAVRPRASTSRAGPSTRSGTRRRATSASMVEREGAGARGTRSCAEYDQYSLREFLTRQGLLARAPSSATACMNFVEADMHNSRSSRSCARTSAGRTSTCRRSSAAWTGCRTPSTRELQDEVRFGRRGHRHRAGRRPRDRPLQDRGRAVHASRGDYAICTDPVLGAARRSRSITPFSREQAAGDPRSSTTTPRPRSCSRSGSGSGRSDDGIFGGATVTDLPIRRMNYPTPRTRHDPRGVLLASYTWGQDALRWGAMDEETRIEEALEDVARIHPADPRGVRGRRVARLVRRPLGARRVRAVRARAADATSRRTSSRPRAASTSPASTCSLYHAWIQGALESGIRAAREIHEAARSWSRSQRATTPSRTWTSNAACRTPPSPGSGDESERDVRPRSEQPGTDHEEGHGQSPFGMALADPTTLRPARWQLTRP